MGAGQRARLQGVALSSIKNVFFGDLAEYLDLSPYIIHLLNHPIYSLGISSTPETPRIQDHRLEEPPSNLVRYMRCEGIMYSTHIVYMYASEEQGCETMFIVLGR